VIKQAEGETPMRPEVVAGPPYHIDQLIKLGEERSNNLRRHLRTIPGYGDEYDSMMEDPRLEHHNFFHARHCEKFGKKTLRHFVAHYVGHPEWGDIFQDQNAPADISAFMLFHYFHDLTQLSFTYYNIQNPGPDLHDKRGHAEGGAIQILAFTEEYANQNNLSFEEAWGITSAAAIMMMRHDEPRMFDQTFDPENKLSRDEWSRYDDQQLHDAFVQNRIDPFDISPSDLMRIYAVKRRNWKIGDYNFPGQFEASFGGALQSMREKNIPLGQTMDEKRKKRIKTLTEMAYLADVKDMIAPYSEQIFRTLLTPVSQSRPFFDLLGGDVDSFMDKVFDVQGNLDRDCDVRRILWEMYHAGEISAQSAVMMVPQEYEFIREHVILGALLLRKLGRDIPDGDFATIMHIYTGRIDQYAVEYNKIMSTGNTETLQESKLNYERRTGLLFIEMQALIEMLSRKMFQSQHNGSEEQFEHIMTIFLDHLRETYEINDEEMAQMEQTVTSLESADTLDFDSDPPLACFRYGSTKKVGRG